MKKIVAGLIVIVVLSACNTGPTADQIQGTVVAQVTALAKAPTPYPTYTPQSTSAPLPTYTPAPPIVVTVQVTATPVPACTNPVTLDVKDGKVSYHGITFSVDPVLGKSVTVQDCPVVPYQEDMPWVAHPAYTSFEFSTDRLRLDVKPEVQVYTVAGDMASYPDPLNSLGDLESMITHRSTPITWFDHRLWPVGREDEARLHVHRNYLDFSNGAGVRGVVIFEGDYHLFFTNNSLRYEFDGLTKDGRYYVQVQFPIATSFLMDIAGADPTTNVNPHAISIPKWPRDSTEQAKIIEAYNNESLRRFEKTTDSDFTPNLAALDALVKSLKITSP